MTLLKQRLVAAHRAGDWELAKRLSQEKEKAKKKRSCAICGIRIKHGIHCYMHSIKHRYYSRALPALCLLLLVGCVAKKPVYAPMAAAQYEVVLPPGRTVTLTWSNVPRMDAVLFYTGVEASTNLRDWAQVWTGEYLWQGWLTLSNRPESEFYRAFNAHR